MGGLLGRIRVRSKMMLLMMVAIISLVAVQALFLNQVWNDINAERRAALSELTDVAYSLIERQHKLVRSGEKSKQAGQEEALADLRSLRYAGNDYFFVLDTDHNMLMHPISSKIDGTNVKDLRDTNGKMLMRELVNVARADGSGFVDYYWERPDSPEPVAKLSYARYDSQWNWVVATGVYTDDIVEIFWSEFWTSLQALVGAIVAFGIVSSLITRAMVTPALALQNVMIKVSDSHDLTLRADIPNSDEFGQMGNAFNDMLDNFQQLILEITSATSQVSSAATELSTTTEQTKQGMVQQQSETTMVATAMNEMNATVHDVTKNTQEAASASRDAADAACSGKEVVDAAIGAVKALSERLTESAELTQTLKMESDNISNILEVINGIAEQTNLLALNAAIEAARAGDQGRGFAVVADEVRSLSARTAESTQEISAVIERLQTGTQAAASAMTICSTEADIVVEQTLKAGDSLTQISAAIEQIDSMTIQIASASEEQSAVAEEINHNIVNINSVSEEGSRGATQVAQASEELARLAEHLKIASERFTVEA